MDISDIDANFKTSRITNTSARWYAPDAPGLRLYGTAQGMGLSFPLRRLPAEIAASVSPGVSELSLHTSGVRLRFVTSSPYIAVKAVLPYADKMPHMPLTGSSGFDVYVDCGDGFTFQSSIQPVWGEARVAGECFVGANEKEVMLNFPLYNGVNSFLLGLDESAVIKPPREYACPSPVVFYGSSITQGGCASRPGNQYPAHLSRMLDCDIIDLGFSGQAHGEDAIAEYVAALDMSVFVYDYDHNAPDCAALDATHSRMFEIIRSKRPCLPVIFMSRPDFYADRADCVMRRDIVRKTYVNAVESSDKNVYFVDGEALFGRDSRDACTVDGTHPNDLGFYRMAKAVYPALQTALSSLYKHV